MQCHVESIIKDRKVETVKTKVVVRVVQSLVELGIKEDDSSENTDVYKVSLEEYRERLPQYYLEHIFNAMSRGVNHQDYGQESEKEGEEETPDRDEKGLLLHSLGQLPNPPLRWEEEEESGGGRRQRHVERTKYVNRDGSGNKYRSGFATTILKSKL